MEPGISEKTIYTAAINMLFLLTTSVFESFDSPSSLIKLMLLFLYRSLKILFVEGCFSGLLIWSFLALMGKMSQINSKMALTWHSFGRNSPLRCFIFNSLHVSLHYQNWLKIQWCILKGMYICSPEFS